MATVLTGCIGSPIKQVAISDLQAEMALNTALGVIGKPYVWGGRGPNKFDCSGLITWSYKKALGRNALFRIGNRTTGDATMQDLWRYNVTRLLPNDLQPGDIIFITGEKDSITHGGLFTRWINNSEFEFINASSHYGEVVVDTWSLDGAKRGQWFIGAGRLKIVQRNVRR